MKRKAAKKFGLDGRTSNPKYVDPETLLRSLGETHPHLAEFLAGWTEGSTSFEGGFLGIFVAEDGVKGLLSHTQCGRKCVLTASGYPEVLQALESGLEADTLPWRATERNGKGSR